MQYIIDPERISALGGADLANPYARFTPAIGVSAEDFSFQNSFDSLKGQTESLSVAGMTGSIDTIDKAIPGRDRDDKKDENGIDYQDVMEAHERIQNEIRQIAVGGISLSSEEWDNVRDNLSDPNKRSVVEDRLRAQGKSDAQIQEGIYLAQMAATIAEKRTRGEELTAEERAAEERLSDPAVRANVEDVIAASKDPITPRSQNDLSREEVVTADVAAIEDTSQFVSVGSRTLDEGSRIESIVDVREGVSVVGSTDLASSFEAGFSAAPEFNARASDNAQLAQAELQQSAPNQSGPVIATL